MAGIKALMPPALGGLAGLGLSAAFWLPAFVERQYVRVDQWFDGRYAYRGHFVELTQFFSPAWGFGVSIPGPDDAISFQIGAAILHLRRAGHPVYLAGGGPAALGDRLLRRGHAGGDLCDQRVGAAAVGDADPGRVVAERTIPVALARDRNACVSVLAALIGHHTILREQGRLSLPLLAVVTTLILASYPYLRVEISEPAEGPVSLAGLMRFQQSSDEMTGSTAWVKEIPTWSPMADYYISQDQAGGPVKPVDTKLDYTIFDYETFGASSVAHSTISEEVFYANRRSSPQTIVFNHFYYPGWNAYLLDGEHGARVTQVPITPETTGALGRMTVQVPPGEGYLLLVYEDTPPRTWAASSRWRRWGLLLARRAAGRWRRQSQAADA